MSQIFVACDRPSGDLLWATLTLIPIGLPGLVYALTSVLSHRRMDFGLGGGRGVVEVDRPGGGRKARLFIIIILPLYLLVMPAWAVLIPVFRW